MEKYQDYIKHRRPLSLQRQCEDAFVKYCIKYKLEVGRPLIKRMTLNVGFDLLRQKYILDKLDYKIGMFDLEMIINSVLLQYHKDKF